MNKMGIQSSFECLACVQMPFGLPKNLKGATTYRHAVALETSVEIYK
jgi:hypothetical protein